MKGMDMIVKDVTKQPTLQKANVEARVPNIPQTECRVQVV